MCDKNLSLIPLGVRRYHEACGRDGIGDGGGALARAGVWEGVGGIGKRVAGGPTGRCGAARGEEGHVKTSQGTWGPWGDRPQSSSPDSRGDQGQVCMSPHPFWVPTSALHNFLDDLGQVA